MSVARLELIALVGDPLRIEAITARLCCGIRGGACEPSAAITFIRVISIFGHSTSTFPSASESAAGSTCFETHRLIINDALSLVRPYFPSIAWLVVRCCHDLVHVR